MHISRHVEFFITVQHIEHKYCENGENITVYHNIYLFLERNPECQSGEPEHYSIHTYSQNVILNDRILRYFSRINEKLGVNNFAVYPE